MMNCLFIWMCQVLILTNYRSLQREIPLQSLGKENFRYMICVASTNWKLIMDHFSGKLNYL